MEAFSSNNPTPGKPRFWRIEADGSKTHESMQRGARSLTEAEQWIRKAAEQGDERALAALRSLS